MIQRFRKWWRCKFGYWKCQGCGHRLGTGHGYSCSNKKRLIPWLRRVKGEWL